MNATAATKPVSNFALYKRLLGYIGPERPAFLLAFLGFVMFSAANVWFTSLVGQIIDFIPQSANMSEASRLMIPLTLVGIVLLRGIGGLLGSYCTALLAFRIIHRLRTQILQRFLRLPLPFFERSNSGHLISSVTFNVSQISAAVSDALAVLLREGLTIIGLVLWLLYLNWQLTLVFIAVTPFISLVVMYASTRFRKHSKRIQHSMGDVTQILNESIKGLKVIRTFGAEAQVDNRFVEVSQRNTRQNLKLALTAAVSAPIIQTLVATALALLIWLALAPDALGDISSGDFVQFITAAGMMLKPVRQTSKTNADIQKGLAAASSIFVLIDADAEQDVGTLEVDRAKGRVEFCQVHFGYPGASEPVLRGIDLVCEPGQTVAIVGHSGSGKSTLVNLLPRFYEPDSGDILLDGISIRDYRLHNLRSQIALVSQQVVLFNGTIRDNVAYGELAGVSDDALQQALDHAHASEFIRELPEGLDTLVGDDGLLLSGGQRQRLAIARALLKNAPILILDEATSALDSASERYIREALQLLMQGRTTLVIAHRLSTIENADRIVVMDKGRIVENGTHQQLLAYGGIYATLHKLQFAEVVSE